MFVYYLIDYMYFTLNIRGNQGGKIPHFKEKKPNPETWVEHYFWLKTLS